jgi:hypothetical protein
MNHELILLIFSIFIVFNLSQIISESTFPLFKWLRRLETNRYLLVSYIGQLFSCFLCTSVWAGWVVSILVFDLGSVLQVEHSWFWTGLFYSSIAWFLHCVEAKLG